MDASKQTTTPARGSPRIAFAYPLPGGLPHPKPFVSIPKAQECSLFPDLPVLMDGDGENHHHDTKHGPIDLCSGDLTEA